MLKHKQYELFLAKMYFTILAIGIMLAFVVNILLLTVTVNAASPDVTEEVIVPAIEMLPDEEEAIIETKEEQFLSIRQEELLNDISISENIATEDDVLSEYDINDINLLCRVVMSEGGSLAYEGKRAIAEVVLNRVASPEFPDTISLVINQPNQFWTGDNGEPTDECHQAVIDALSSRMFPEDMFWFQKAEPSYGYECYYDGIHHYSSATKH